MKSSRLKFLSGLAYWLIAVVLTILFWLPLWQGGGFVGGDLYSYFFPQKVIYSESLDNQEIPLWNNRTGWGYPLLGESQTGVFYPTNLILYQILPPNAAYHWNQILHYILAFVATVLLARKTGLSVYSSLLAALVFVYGWFPARTCVEWAILTGAWLPVSLLFLETFLQTLRWRYLILMSFSLGIQLLAGHYNLAFITQLTLVIYLFARILIRGKVSENDEAENSKKNQSAPNAVQSLDDPLNRSSAILKKTRFQLIGLSLLFLFLGGLLGSIQVLPTYELKKLSQREDVNENHHAEQGAIPFWYFKQIIHPAYWYSRFTNRSEEFKDHPPFKNAGTNEVEAHLYIGLIPLGLVLWSFGNLYRRRDPRTLIWLILALFFGIYTTGILLPVTGYLPGFQYFQGLGRYGITTTLAFGLLAGLALDQFLFQPMTRLKVTIICFFLLLSFYTCWSLSSEVDLIHTRIGGIHTYSFGPFALTTNFWIVLMILVLFLALWGINLLFRDDPKQLSKGRFFLFFALFLISLGEFWIISRNITYSTMLNDPPVSHLSASPVKGILSDYPKPARLWSPGANIPNLFGSSSLPVYLTFGPKQYFNEKWKMPERANTNDSTPANGQLDWLKRNGVTHILSFHPLDPELWYCKLLWQGMDPVFNPSIARFREPIYLYELNESPGRVYLVDANHQIDESGALGSVSITQYKTNEIKVDANIKKPATLVLTDLKFPGWKVSLDGQTLPDEPQTTESEVLFREIDLQPGEHQIVWSYQPESVYWGVILSLIALIILATFGHLAFWHHKRLNKLLRLNVY